MRRLARQPQVLVGRLSEFPCISSWRAFSSEEPGSDPGPSGRGRGRGVDGQKGYLPRAPGAPQAPRPGPQQQAPGSPKLPQGRGRGQVYSLGQQRQPQQPSDQHSRGERRDTRPPSPRLQQRGPPQGDNRMQQFRPRDARRPLPRAPGDTSGAPGLLGPSAPGDFDPDDVMEDGPQRRSRNRTVTSRGRSEPYRDRGGMQHGRGRGGRGSDQLMDPRDQRAGAGRGAIFAGRRPQPRSNLQSRGRGPRPRFRQADEDPKAAALLDELGKYELDPGEPMAFIDRKSQARIRDMRDMPRTDQQEDMEFLRHLMLEMDLETNINMSAPRRLEQQRPDEMAESLKAEAMDVLGIETEEEWQEVKDGALEGFDESFQLLKKQVRARDAKAEEAVLDRMLWDSFPPDHPMFPTVEMSVKQLQRNPFWPFEQKEKYVKRLIHDLGANPLSTLKA